ncbi:MAG TPA: efflux RND transporter periplasmic adaptor subunit [Pontibacter sp.]
MKKIVYSGCMLATGSLLLFSACSQTTSKPIDDAPLSAEFCISDSLSAMVRVDTAQLRPVESQLQLSGKVMFDARKVFHIYPLVGGYAQEVKAELGDYVQKGQVLAVIKSSEVAGFEEQLITAQSQMRLAQKDLDVAGDMYEAGLVSEKDLIAAQQEKKNAEAALKHIREIYNIYSIGKGSEYIIKAPAAGFIVDRRINADTQIRPDNDEILFTISNLNEIWVMANVYESDIAKVKEGYSAEVSTLSYPGKVFQGKIDKVFNVLDPETRTMKVRVRLDNPDFVLKPEMFANVKISYPEDRQLVAVPAEAVIMENSKKYVMVYRKRCDVSTRQVEPYQTVGNTTYLLSGVEAGEPVISKYSLLVYDATK